MARLEEQTLENYEKITHRLQTRYIRGLIDYFYAEWRYNHYLKRITPVYVIFFSTKYFSMLRRYGYAHQSNVVNGYGPLNEEEVTKKVLEDIEEVMQKDLLVDKAPKIKHMHVRETISLVTNLFAEGKIRTFRLGTDVKVNHLKNAEEYLTLEIVDNAANILKWDINKEVRPCYKEFNQHILDTINLQTL